MSMFLTPVNGLKNKPLSDVEQSSQQKSCDYITEMDKAKCNVQNDPPNIRSYDMGTMHHFAWLLIRYGDVDILIIYRHLHFGI